MMRSKQRAIVASLAVAMFVAAFVAYRASAGRAIAPDPHDPDLAGGTERAALGSDLVLDPAGPRELQRSDGRIFLLSCPGHDRITSGQDSRGRSVRTTARSRPLERG